MATFLTSSLNVELVHVILDAITKGKASTMIDHTVNALNFTSKAFFTEEHKHTIDTITIKNPDKWKTVKLPEFLEQKSEQFTIKNKGTIKIQKEKSNGGDMKVPMIDQIEDAEKDEEEVLIINEDVKVTEYAPKVFAFLRQLDSIDNNMLKESLSPEVNRESVFRAGESQGKSGSFFFFSHDKNFIIKTMTESDLSTFKKLFQDYFKGVTTRQQHSLLARIYGIYTIKMEEVEPVHLILMGNTKRSNDKNILHVFDLKGSFINREVIGKNLKNTATLKDINLLNLKN